MPGQLQIETDKNKLIFRRPKKNFQLFSLKPIILLVSQPS
jgi:hypothetical protein